MEQNLKNLKTELRKILVGRTMTDHEGWLIAIPEGNGMVFHGIADSTATLRLTSRECSLKVADSADQAFQIMLRHMQRRGRLVRLESLPEALVCLQRRYLSRSLLYCITNETQGSVKIVVYAGKSIIGKFQCRWALRQLRKELEEKKS